MSGLVYLDSSAIVKLAVEEEESSALRAFLRDQTSVVSSSVARTEVARALMGKGEDAVARGLGVLARIDLIRVTEDILAFAGTLLPGGLSSLLAIHLASALKLGAELDHLITYDRVMTAFAGRQGIHAFAPADTVAGADALYFRDKWPGPSPLE